ncbi:MAG TPA: hypothetical protein VG895_04140 [Patescibacteria group bacterium]|nr:hypothetical protein [Patescibacteria group bacterium]
MGERIQSIGNAQSSRVRTEVQLPYGQEDSIGIDTTYATQLIHLAGFRHLKIVSKNNGDVSSVEAQIIGRSGNSAIMGATKVNEVAIQSNELNPDKHIKGNSKHYSWPELQVNLNTSEIRQRINDKGLATKNSSEWSNQINLAIKQAIRKQGTEHLLLSKTTLTDKLDGFQIVLCFGSIIAGEAYPIYPTIIIGLTQGARIVRSFENLQGLENFKEGRGYRLSLIPGIEIDRWLLLQAYSRVKPLVAPLNNK